MNRLCVYKDGGETDVDCGGSFCEPCTTASKCLVDSDCLYNNCPEPLLASSDRVCTPPPKSCPNDCGNPTRGVCKHVSSISGDELLPADCLSDAPVAACRTTCVCLDGYGGDGCQYTREELEAAAGVRQRALEYIRDSDAVLDVTKDTLTRQTTLLATVSVDAKGAKGVVVANEATVEGWSVGRWRGISL